MADNKVVESIEAPGGLRCVDIFRRPDGTWGFEEYRRDPEEGTGWFCVGFHGNAAYPDEGSARESARAMVKWMLESGA